MSIYGPYEETLNNILADVERRLAEWNNYQLAARALDRPGKDTR